MDDPDALCGRRSWLQIRGEGRRHRGSNALYGRVVTEARTRMKPAPGVAAQRLDDETVLVHLRTNDVFALNETGARVWELIGEGVDREELLGRLSEEFDVALGQLAHEVDVLLAELFAEGLLEPAE